MQSSTYNCSSPYFSTSTAAQITTINAGIPVRHEVLFIIQTSLILMIDYYLTNKKWIFSQYLGVLMIL